MVKPIYQKIINLNFQSWIVLKTFDNYPKSLYKYQFLNISYNSRVFCGLKAPERKNKFKNLGKTNITFTNRMSSAF